VQEEKQPNLGRRVRLQSLLNRNKVFQTLGHFLTFNVEMAGMEKVVDPLLAVEVALHF
jgi:hypothetical protein